MAEQFVVGDILARLTVSTQDWSRGLQQARQQLQQFGQQTSQQLGQASQAVQNGTRQMTQGLSGLLVAPRAFSQVSDCSISAVWAGATWLLGAHEERRHAVLRYL